MRKVDDDPQLVHALDNGDAEIREPRIRALGAAVAEQVVRVVGQLDAPRSLFVEGVEVVMGT